MAARTVQARHLTTFRATALPLLVLCVKLTLSSREIHLYYKGPLAWRCPSVYKLMAGNFCDVGIYRPQRSIKSPFRLTAVTGK
jgi:hypothetical protein